ncbi:MAG: Stk1 family PASTA domain-containing Ser/Thr kinase [Bowdeniella nasicola]|nr:Stk1 family PASTA domain-containing Ser/Thr kinase [Bowdeniella nasicola]
MDRHDNSTQGAVIDHRYEIVRRIARGGMSQVYVAHDRRLERDVALKIMHPYLAESDEFVRLFRREARAAARLSHPNVVAVHDQGTTGDSFYLTMEYVRGGNLRNLLDSHGPLTLGRALEITEQILSALALAHRAGLVHRDIKPENVLTPTDGGVKVADFGLARAISEASISGTGTVLGTVAYLAPEVVTDGISSPSADVYAVGILLYEMLTGTPPFTGERPIQVAYRHVNEDVPAPSHIAEFLPREVDELVAALTAREISDREPDAHTALTHLRRVLTDLPADLLAQRHEVEPAEQSSPPLPTPPDVTRPEAHRQQHGTRPLPSRDTAPLNTSEPLLAVPVGAVKAEDPAPPRRKRRWPIALLALVLLVLGGTSAWWFTLGPGGYTTLPDVSGQLEAEALDAVQEAGFAGIVERAHSDDVEEGLVISTDPEAGSVKKGSTITLTVSKGVKMIAVPTLAGLTEEEGRAAITTAEGTLGEVTSEYSDSVEADHIISASAEAGASIPHHQPIDLVVSLGPAPVTFPNVVGTPIDEARASLEEQGLNVTSTEEFSSDVKAGLVISQDPAAGASGHRGDAIALTVSKGPETFPVPDVFGMQSQRAVQVLKDAGFNVKVNKVLGGVFGTVRSQDPGAETMVPRGTTITITVV